MPVLCQHCEAAPCEPVCPVYATYHTPEGLNAQLYNRCVGTRFCANNCPYTVRFFNWFDPDWPVPLDEQLNPDVSIRPSGVMEKCTFCIQRIHRAQDTAKDEQRPVRDGEVKPACAQACPADAMVFGDLTDPNSRVSKLAASRRAFRLLEELGTRPRVIYLKQEGE
jgi:Fe-S-cluster-containing dehydrogenase component